LVPAWAATRNIRPGPSTLRISVSKHSKNGARGPSAIIAFAAPNSRSAWSKDAAATGISGASGNPCWPDIANSTQPLAAPSSLFPAPWGLPRSTRR